MKLVISICLTVFFLTSQAWAGTVCNKEMTPAAQADHSVMTMNSDKSSPGCNDLSNGEMSDLCASACMVGCLNVTLNALPSVSGDGFAYNLDLESPTDDSVFIGYPASDPPPPRL